MKGSLVFRYKSEDGVAELVSPTELDDGEWHKVDLVKTTSRYGAYTPNTSHFIDNLLECLVCY